MAIEGSKELVVALYDYSYISDDGEKIEMKTEEKYFLVDSTNDEWWQVKRGDRDIFYVPANYVERLGTDEQASMVDGAKQPPAGLADNTNRLIFPQEKDPPTSFKDTKDDVEMNSEDSSFSFLTSGNKTVIQVNNSNPTAQMTFKVTGIGDDPGDYVNLDDYRQAAGITQKEAKNDESEYANLQEVLAHGHPSCPSPDDGEFVKTLLGIWKMYLDPKTSRNYYYHTSTHELTWKPPRHAERLSDNEKKSGEDVTPDKLREEVTDTTDVFCAGDSTKEKFLCSRDERGQKHAGSSHPQTRSENGDILLDDGLGLPSKIDRLERWNKARSMVLDINFNQPPHIHKSSTLPSNVQNVSHTRISPSSEDLPVRAVTPLSPPPLSLPGFSHEIDGIMQRTKILENGKKMKKNWSTCYVKLVGSNLVFYKDQRAAAIKPGSPHGKTDFIVPLQGAQVQNNPKDISSKKNTIKLCATNGNHFLLRVDDDIKILQWFTKIQLTISDLNPGMKLDINQSDREKPHTSLHRQPSSKGHIRNSSADDTAEKKSKIREVLRNLMSRRPPIETLEKKGIIKETVFGAHLKHICDRERTKIPNFVRLCITAIEARGLDHDGMYRVSGNLAQIQKLRYAVDQDEALNLNDTDLWDINVLTGGLKLFFRELKEPLFPFNLFETFRDAVVKPTNAERLKEVRSHISELPKYNCETMKMLFSHLLRVIDLSHKNRMQVQNVAIVFGPTLIWPEREQPNIAASMVFQGRIVEYFLLEYKKIFK